MLPWSNMLVGNEHVPMRMVIPERTTSTTAQPEARANAELILNGLHLRGTSTSKTRGAGWLVSWDVKATKELDMSPGRKLFGFPYPFCQARVICAPFWAPVVARRVLNTKFLWSTCGFSLRSAKIQWIQQPVLLVTAAPAGRIKDSCPFFQVRWKEVSSNRFDQVGKKVSSSRLSKVVKQAWSDRLENVGKEV